MNVFLCWYALGSAAALASEPHCSQFNRKIVLYQEFNATPEAINSPGGQPSAKQAGAKGPPGITNPNNHDGALPISP